MIMGNAQRQILLVDDEELLLDVAKEMLVRVGFRVLTAQNGEEALEIFEQHLAEIDGVVLDVVMPGIDGIETFRQLRRIRPDLPIVLSSGYSRSRVPGELLSSGRATFLGKPYTLAQLDSAVLGAIAD